MKHGQVQDRSLLVQLTGFVDGSDVRGKIKWRIVSEFRVCKVGRIIAPFTELGKTICEVEVKNSVFNIFSIGCLYLSKSKPNVGF